MKRFGLSAAMNVQKLLGALAILVCLLGCEAVPDVSYTSDEGVSSRRSVVRHRVLRAHRV
jgi:hypothetical protein